MRSALNGVRTAAGLAAALCLAPGWAAGNPELVQAQRQYRLERAHCNSGQSHQDRATCLKEANAAYGEARRGALANATGADLAGNALRRCDAQPQADREACVQRITGAGNVDGSVKAGGVIRRSETPVR